MLFLYFRCRVFFKYLFKLNLMPDKTLDNLLIKFKKFSNNIIYVLIEQFYCKVKKNISNKFIES